MRKKNLIALTATALLFFKVQAQNTFPATGNAGVGTTSPENSEIWNSVFEVKGPSHAKSIVTGSGITTGVWSHSPGTYGAPAGGIMGTWTNHPVSFMTNQQTRMTIASDGNIGIGTTTPTAKLNVAGNTAISGQLIVGNATNFQLSGDHNASIYRGLNVTTQASKKTVYMYSDESYQMIDAYDYNTLTPLPLRVSYSGGNTLIGNDNSGRTGIGTSNPTERLDVAGNIYTNGKILINQANTAAVTPYSLAVNGSAIFTKAVVKLNGNWPDYVFSKNYELPTLANVEKYISENNHLPGIISAQEAEKTGINLGDNQTALLKKVEELTLYLIELDKKVAALTKENEAIKAKMKN